MPSRRSWLADALLGSPIPPPLWLDPRNAGSGWRSPGSRRYRYKIPASQIQAELAERGNTINPPVVQGWAWVLGALCALAWGLGAWLLAHSSAADLLGVALFVGPLPAWLGAVCVGGFVNRDVQLRDGRVAVRRWADVWLGREGRVVGPPARVAATIGHGDRSAGDRLWLTGEAASADVSLALWPSSSRAAIRQRLEKWGAGFETKGRHSPDM